MKHTWSNFIGGDSVVIEISNQKELDRFNLLSAICHLYGLEYWEKHCFNQLLRYQECSGKKICVEYSCYKGFTYGDAMDYIKSDYIVIPFIDIWNEFFSNPC